MSTMYEALKKAEAGRIKSALKAPAPATTPAAEGKGPFTFTPLNILLVVILLVVVWLSINVAGYYQQYQRRQAAAAKRAAVVKAAAVAPGVPVATAPKHLPGTYGLDGIIFAGENSIAVINGKSLRIGGKIGPLTVQKIASDQVEVLDARDGSTQVLRPE